jgi:TRAP-type uncharacterized transport system substrate-binding protein
MDRLLTLSRALLMALFSLCIATPLWAEPQEEQLQNDQMQSDQPQIARPRHKLKPVVHRVDRAEQLRHQLRDQLNAGLVGIVSEGTDETAEMALALTAQAGHDHLRLLPIAGAGASQNAEDVMLTHGIDIGIVQADALDEIKRNPPFPGVEQYLRYITRLYDRQVQLLAGPDIKSIEDLTGKKVNFGPRDSGSYTTATNIFKALGVAPEVMTLSHTLALDKLRRGEISALVYVATKPSRLLQDIRPDEDLHLVPITGNLPTNYTPTTITSDDYPELVSEDGPVKTVEVGTVLMAYNWPAGSVRYQRVNFFVQTFLGHVKDIQARHPKWHQFDVTSSLSGWTRFSPAVEWLKKAGLTPEEAKTTVVYRDAPQQNALFAAFVQRLALFREFAAYEKEHWRTTVAYDDH